MAERIGEIRRAISAYLWVSPVLVCIVGLIAYPVFRSVQLSLYDWDLGEMEHPFIGLQGYIKVLVDPGFREIVWNSSVWTLGVVLISLVFGLAMALLLNEEFKGKTLVVLLLLIPWATPRVVIALAWKWMYASTFGILDYLLRVFSLDSLHRLWLGDPEIALYSVMAPMIWRDYTFEAFIYLAALKGVPKELYEAADVDGAGPVHKFIHVTLPGIMPTLIVVNLLETMWNFNVIQMIWIMTEGGPIDSTTTLPVKVYKVAFQYFLFGKASVYAVFTCLFLVVFMFAYLKVARVRGDGD
ncbi:MAG: sugar ABC transporter permease [Deltaproteobacteria bacterium]|nr:sugar ABC transporter permease [Deltaproteobacteria bacterium]MBW2123766.1 sugar ABC transporter permease [Deltaproteobacteria bacterium]